MHPLAARARHQAARACLQHRDVAGAQRGAGGVAGPGPRGGATRRARRRRVDPLGGAEVSDAVHSYLGQLIDADPAIDTLLLGCTHYPLLRPLIEEVVGPRVAVVDSAFSTAIAAEDLLDALGARAPEGGAATNLVYTTGDPASFVTVAERIFPGALPGVEQAIVAAD